MVHCHRLAHLCPHRLLTMVGCTALAAWEQICACFYQPQPMWLTKKMAMLVLLHIISTLPITLVPFVPLPRAAYIYLVRGALNTKINQYDASQPPPWTPSSGLPCPCQCFDLTYFNFVSSRFAVSGRQRQGQSTQAHDSCVSCLFRCIRRQCLVVQATGRHCFLTQPCVPRK